MTNLKDCPGLKIETLPSLPLPTTAFKLVSRNQGGLYKYWSKITLGLCIIAEIYYNLTIYRL